MNYENFIKRKKEVVNIIERENHFKLLFFKMLEEEGQELKEKMEKLTSFRPFEKFGYVFDLQDEKLENQLCLHITRKMNELVELSDRHDVFLGFFDEPNVRYDYLSNYFKVKDSDNATQIVFNKEKLTNLNIAFFNNFPLSLYYLFNDFGYHNFDNYIAVMEYLHNKFSRINTFQDPSNKVMCKMNDALINDKEINTEEVLRYFLVLNAGIKRKNRYHDKIFPYYESFEISYNIWEDACKHFKILKSRIFKFDERHGKKVKILQDYLDGIIIDTEKLINKKTL